MAPLRAVFFWMTPPQDFTFLIFNNYSPKWWWLVVDIYRAAKRRGKYQPLWNANYDREDKDYTKWRGKYQPLATHTEVNSCFSIY